MTKTELDGIPMMRVFNAILRLRNDGYKATSTRIAALTGRSVDNIGHIVLYLWDWGYVQRKTIRKKMSRKRDYEPRPNLTQGCIYHYALSKKGYKKLGRLEAEFGNINIKQVQEFQSCVTLPSDTLPAGQVWQPGQQPQALPLGASQIPSLQGNKTGR